MNFRNLSAWSIRNPIVPILAFIGLMVAGLMAFQQMDIQDQPDIEFPVVLVSISQPGAAPPEVENQITQRVEAAVQTLDGIENIRSTASEGSSFTQIEFALGTDIAEAVNEVKSEIDNIRGELPDGILEPRVFKQQTSSQPIVSFGVAADDMTIEELSWFIDDTITKALLTVDGLAEVSRSGGVDREILVILDPGKMQALGVTASQVNSALRQLNLNAAGGQAEIAGSRQSVRVLGNAQSAFELSQTQISLGAGRSVKLSDIARVTDSYGEISTVAKVDGKPVVTFSITRARGESDVRVYDDAIEVMKQLEESNEGVHFTRLFTEVDYTRAQYDSSMALLVEGALLAVIVVFLFLRDWRATIIAALAIPLSAIPTFYFMDLMGFSLNTLSLLALGLVAGVLVDDAIVEIENIVRHMRMGKSAYQASIDAADEIGLAVVATTACIIAVFLPVGMMPGVSGQFFKNFGLTVVVSVAMSLAVARMITPMIAAYFLKSKGEAAHGEGRAMDLYMKVLRWSLDESAYRRRLAEIGRAPFSWQYGFIGTPLFILIAVAAVAGAVGVFYLVFTTPAVQAIDMRFWKELFGFLPEVLAQLLAFLFTLTMMLVTIVAAGVGAWLAAFVLKVPLTILSRLGGERFSTWFLNRTARLRVRFLDHRMWMMGLGIASLCLTVMIGQNVPQQFFPNNDSDFSRVSVSMVPGTTLEQTEEVVDRVAARLSEEQEVDLALGIANEGSGRISLVLAADRQRTSQVFERELTPVLQDIPDARINFNNQQGGGGGTGREISILLSGSDPEKLNEAAQELVTQMETVEGAVAPRIDYDLQRPELIIKPREDLAASLGVTTQALSQAIRIATLGDIDQNAAKFSLSDRQIPIRVRLAEGDRRNVATIENLPVPTGVGGSVPLSRVADISFGMGPASIERYNQNRRVFVGVDVGEGIARGDVYNAIQNLPIMRNLPTGVTDQPVGADEWQQDLIGNFITAVITGLFLVFAVLVLLYRRLVSPLVNMGSLFLAPLGGLALIWALGQPLSLPVFIGVLMLLGIVAKNSILLIDFALEEMETGKSKFEAIMEAGHKRAQPIVMTTVAMTAGMVPTALSLSGDSAWRAPMGTVVIGGLLLSTLLTLLIVPAGFSLADGLEKRLGPWMRDTFLTYKPGDGHGPSATSPEATPAE
ncbi:efflux RND transporter permease subunit [Alteraurantiacibacter aquimixticola]|uniref:Efflux RND transporter permease subunit n=1 Tax=Alteraurantiacibacter aquimixticola TaxID=2489173 RepID=A0A4T3EX85_9SPHN|nr:efflux RND transporter permease subunit [Alteraurantiacibacter aquimixticola]TIX49205.1 efflux RND transporter permease subunit [Alteraurantiacibacter aquimixticola]